MRMTNKLILNDVAGTLLEIYDCTNRLVKVVKDNVIGEIERTFKSDRSKRVELAKESFGVVKLLAVSLAILTKAVRLYQVLEEQDEINHKAPAFNPEPELVDKHMMYMLKNGKYREMLEKEGLSWDFAIKGEGPRELKKP